MSSKETPALNDNFLDSALRPGVWDDYIGQLTIKENLRILLRAARERGQPPEHLLFYGPPGLGKTTLAHLIARELGAQMKTTSGPAIEKVGDLASILTNLSPGDILFIDEVHRLNKLVEEVLYPALEAGMINIVLGKGPGARVIQLDLPPFTLVSATTRIALVSAPLRSRFSGGVYRLDFYTEPEITAIVRRSAKILGVTIEPTAAETIARRSRFTPRVANHLLKRCRDYAQLKKSAVTQVVVKETLALLGVDAAGLGPADRQLLTLMIEKFGGGPVGLNTLATATAEEEATIEEVHEPYLIRLGFLERTPRGRVATAKAYAHLGLDLPPGQKPLL